MTSRIAWLAAAVFAAGCSDAPERTDMKPTDIRREVNSSRVFITGEVAHPGAYPLRGRVSILQAIALAGGFTDFADRDGKTLKQLTHGPGDDTSPAWSPRL